MFLIVLSLFCKLNYFSGAGRGKAKEMVGGKAGHVFEGDDGSMYILSLISNVLNVPVLCIIYYFLIYLHSENQVVLDADKYRTRYLVFRDDDLTNVISQIRVYPEGNGCFVVLHSDDFVNSRVFFLDKVSCSYT